MVLLHKWWSWIVGTVTVTVDVKDGTIEDDDDVLFTDITIGGIEYHWKHAKQKQTEETKRNKPLHDQLVHV